MDTGLLPVAPHLMQLLSGKSITRLYPPQEECLGMGLLDGRNLLVSIPTASGKTLVAEIAMHHHIAQSGKCLYIVPLKALAREKLDDFGGHGVRVGISTGDFDRRDARLGMNDIIVATSEKVDSLLRNNAPWLDAITLLVIDEIHLIDSESRGATLEMVIAKLRCRNPGMQIIGLSATIGNPEDLADWLDAGLVSGTWRPVDLHEGTYCQGTIYFSDGREREVSTPTKYDDLNLCTDIITEGGQCLVFVSSRRNAEGFAKRAAGVIKPDDPAVSGLAEDLAKLAGTETGRVLADCVAHGVAFHHAGLRSEQRKIIETGFRQGAIRVIASTPTLAAGLNLPARRVVIRDCFRFKAGVGMQPIPVREYQQMAGRAGRPGLDPYGEAVLVAKDATAVMEVSDYYINAPPEEVRSRIASEAALSTHILSLFDSRFVDDRSSLVGFMDRTFYAQQKKERQALENVIDRVLAFLDESGMIAGAQDGLRVTKYGTLVSRLYINPYSADLITRTLQGAGTYSDTAFLHLLCSTPDMPTLYVRRPDLHRLDRYLYESGDSLWLDLPIYEDEESVERFYQSLKTALLLQDWISEVPEETICERYGVGPGDVYNAVESVQWLIHAGNRISHMFSPDYSGAVTELEVRMKQGIRRELLPLTRLRGIGRVRARRLFNNGISGPDDILNAGMKRITGILGRGIAEQIWRQLEVGQVERGGGATVRDDPRDDGRSGQMHLYEFE